MSDRRSAEGSEPFPTDHVGEELRNLALVDAMRAVATSDTSATRAVLFQLLLESKVVVLTPDEPDAHRSWTAEAGEVLALVTVHEADGTALPVFTSVESLLRFRPDGGGYVALPASALFQMADAGGTDRIVIDPGSPTGGSITRAEIEALARSRLPIGGAEAVVADTPIRIGRPAVPPPPEVLAAVTESLARTPSASRAWLTMIQQGTLEPEVLIAVRLDDGVGDDVKRTLVDRAGASAPGVRHLRFIRADAAFAHTLDAGAGSVINER